MTRYNKIVHLTQADGLADQDRARLEAHWRDIGGARDIPKRADIDPAAVAPCLDRMLLIERIAPRQAKIRLAGQRVSNLLGHELRGMPLGALVVPPSRDWLGDAIVALFDEPSRIELGMAGPRSPLRGRSRASLMLLPLRDGDGQITRGLGFLTLGHRESAAARFEICGESRRALQCADEKSAPPVVAEPVKEVQEFAAADRARDVLRRRQSFHVVS